MKVKVSSSYTIDHVSWTCPKCGYENDLFNYAEDNGCCEHCDFEIPNYCSRLGECDGEVDTYDVEEEDNEEEYPDLSMWYECPNCGTLVEEDGQYCEDCAIEMGAE